MHADTARHDRRTANARHTEASLDPMFNALQACCRLSFCCCAHNTSPGFAEREREMERLVVGVKSYQILRTFSIAVLACEHCVSAPLHRQTWTLS